MPNKNLNKIVEKIEHGEIFYQANPHPHKIIDTGSRWVLRGPSHVLDAGEKLVATGYRHCPSHWEWVLLLQHHKDAPWVDKVVASFSGQGKPYQINTVAYIIPPVVNIVREPNDLVERGGGDEQISVYLKAEVRRFRWKPSPAQLAKQLQLTCGLYGWGGATGLKAEIFDRI